MEVEGDVVEDIAELGEGAEGELEEAGIVGLLVDLAILLEELIIDLEVILVGQAALMALLGMKYRFLSSRGRAFSMASRMTLGSRSTAT